MSSNSQEEVEDSNVLPPTTAPDDADAAANYGSLGDSIESDLDDSITTDNNDIGKKSEVKKSSSILSEANSSNSDVYIRADGKKVRRVKRKKSKTAGALEATAAVKEPTTTTTDKEDAPLAAKKEEIVATVPSDESWENVPSKEEGAPMFPPPLFSKDIAPPTGLDETKPDTIPLPEFPAVVPEPPKDEEPREPTLPASPSLVPPDSPVPVLQEPECHPSVPQRGSSKDDVSIDAPPSESEAFPELKPVQYDFILEGPEPEPQSIQYDFVLNRQEAEETPAITPVEQANPSESGASSKAATEQAAPYTTSATTSADEEQKNPWTSAPSFEESLLSVDRSIFSQRDDHHSILMAAANPFAVIPEASPASPAAAAPRHYPDPLSPPPDVPSADARYQPESPSPDVPSADSRYQPVPPSAPLMMPTTLSNESILDDLVGARESHDSFDPVNRMAGAAAQALQLHGVPSEEDDTNSMPSFIDTSTHQTATGDADEHSKITTEAFVDEPVVVTSDDDDDEQGGPLWRAALKSRVDSQQRKPRLPESIRSQARSRADVDSLDFESPDRGGTYDRSPGNMHEINDDDAFIMNATLARKRVRVVQLLVFGLLGFLLAFLGSFYVQSTCHFVSAQVAVGNNNEVFELHYGFWKYSPIDSAFQGYSYCAKYDEEYTADAPFIPRISGTIGLVAGSYSLLIMWAYLIFGRASYKLWGWAVSMALVAAVCQGLTFLFFAGEVCQRNTCTMGPGAAMGVVSTIMWVLVAYELYYNAPTSVMTTHIDPGRHGANLMSNLEMSDFGQGAKSYVMRMSTSGGNALPTLNSLQRKRPGGSVGSHMMDSNSRRRQGSYKPPDYRNDATYDL